MFRAGEYNIVISEAVLGQKELINHGAYVQQGVANDED